LGHDQLNILVLKTSSIDLLPIILVIILLVITCIDGLALAMVVA
jgi:archaellum biogenesis protein FlaJ (TadC family)